MSTENDKAAVRQFYEEVFNKKNLAGVDAFVSSNQIDHGLPPGFPAGMEGSKQFIGMYLTAFPDLHVTVEDMISEGDKITSRCTYRGTHRGELMGIPPTGKQVTVTGIEINRFEDGKSVEHWLEYDALGMLQQLGVVPAAGQTS